MLEPARRHWNIQQWSAFLTAQELPCMPRSKMLLRALEEAEGDDLSAAELASIAASDPFLCLRLLREAEKRRSRRLGHDTTTPLAAVMQIGTTTFRNLLYGSPEVDDASAGLAACESRAVLASQMALVWGSARADISPHEIALATLLAEIGELLLWAFAPEMPQAALAALAAGQAPRSALAQEATCGFRFRALSLECATLWELPPLVVQLIRGVDTVRANISRVCLDTARHLVAGADSPALPTDLAEAKRLIPQASTEWLAARMVGLDEERQAEVVAAANEILAQLPKE